RPDDIPTKVTTLHRLLGTLPDQRGRFRHHAENPLPYDVVVVDEMSMVSLPMMARVLEAVRPTAHLVLVGDPDQLSSVEAGAVMADITGAASSSSSDSHHAARGESDDAGGSGDAGYADLPALADDGRGLPLPLDVRHGVVRLTHTWRFGGAIDELAQAIRRGDDDAVITVLRGGHDDVRFREIRQDEVEAEATADLRASIMDSGTALVTAARASIDIPEASTEAFDRAAITALGALDAHRLLCAHRTGPYGVARWSWEADRWLAPVTAEAGRLTDEWYAGRPILITANDYELGLFNGDTGVVIATREGLRAVFARGQRILSFAPARLEDVQTVHAMTVHRSQGSQFREVSFVVPPADSPLLTRELLYTAVTRASTTVTVIGSEAALRRAVTRPANRASGLRHRL
ncbi:MAG: exodeoxyribonuclease V subunit alpha, partial [Propionibacteriales bacterium]|nr:exodeoxyribonuclease V subunit alpha [Propionibacteriales bacterium]